MTNHQKLEKKQLKLLKKISNDVKNLIPIFEKGMNAISVEITSKVMKNGSKQFYNHNKPFLNLITYNPYNNRVYLFRSNKRIEGVTPMKGNPKWGVITFQNINELNTVLEAAKGSYILFKESL
nr:hypothetical protein [Methanobacterium formicicum]